MTPFSATDGYFHSPTEINLPRDENSFKSKIIPYVIYFVLLTCAMLHEWYGSRDPQALSWLKFAAKNKEVTVTNVIANPQPQDSSGELLAVEISGSISGEKRAISNGTRKIVKLAFTPKVGEKLTLSIKNGQVHVTRSGD